MAIFHENILNTSKNMWKKYFHNVKHTYLEFKKVIEYYTGRDLSTTSPHGLKPLNGKKIIFKYVV